MPAPKKYVDHVHPGVVLKQLMDEKHLLLSEVVEGTGLSADVIKSLLQKTAYPTKKQSALLGPYLGKGKHYFLTLAEHHRDAGDPE